MMLFMIPHYTFEMACQSTLLASMFQLQVVRMVAWNEVNGGNLNDWN
jgi:hypothetical protein